jgi:tetratricopeptide (TPR) repeat protein
MSYINEALKKAQKERDGRIDSYEGVLNAEKPKRGVRSKPVLKWAIPCFIIVFLAFFLFSWLDSDNSTSIGKKDTGSDEDQGLPDVVHASIAFHRARLFQKEGQKEKAKKNYLETLELNPRDVKALNNLGVIYMQEKNYPRAMAHFQKAIKMKADYVEPYYNLACLYTMQKDQEKGLSFLKKAASLDRSAILWAQEDPDLVTLLAAPAFQALLGEKD